MCKIVDKDVFEASSLDVGTIVGLPDEDTHMYAIETLSGNVIRCTEHYFKEVTVSKEDK